MGPGFYSDIGKRVRDLLYDGFFWDEKLEHGTNFGCHQTANGAVKKDFSLSVEMKPQLSLDEIASRKPETTLYFEWPEWRSSQVEFRYLHDYVGIVANLGLGKITKYNARLCIVNDDLITSVALSHKGNKLSGSYYYPVNPKTRAAVGGVLRYRFSTDQTTMTCRAQLALDPCTILKVRANNHGKIGALIRYNWHPKSYYAIACEIDRKSILQGSKVGLHLVL